jgi:hypothetical protein
MLCNLAQLFPPLVEGFLERSRTLRRRFREETITDLLMGSLITAGGGRVIVDFPDEPVTGADMEWNFVNPDDRTFFRILLQAKQCYGDGKVWTRHGYRELLHTAGSSSRLQAVALCDASRADIATYPLYILYHSETTCKAARKEGFHTVTGASLADGYVIEKLVKKAVSRTLRTRNKSLKTIAPILFHMHELFCPPTILGHDAVISPGFAYIFTVRRNGGQPVIGIPAPPTPTRIRERILESRRTFTDSEKDFTDLPSVPEISKRIPEEVLTAIKRDGHRLPSDPPLRRWRVTFVSASPSDRDAEMIGQVVPRDHG